MVTEDLERQVRELAEQLHFQVGLLDAVAQAVIATDLDGIILHWNRYAEKLYGWPAHDVLGRNVRDISPLRETYTPARSLAHRLRPGETWSAEFTLRRHDGGLLNVLVLDSPIHDPRGSVTGVVSVSVDITERKRAEDNARRLAQEQAARAAAEAAQRRFSFLAEAGGILASSLKYENTVAQVARLAVPFLADWCAVHLAEPDGSIRALTIAHVDPAKKAWAETVEARYPLDPADPQGIPRVLATGQPILWAEIPEPLLQAAARDAEHGELLRELGPRSCMVVPLQARGRILGTLSLLITTPKRKYGPDDLALASDLARRVALAIDNALLYAEVVQGTQRKDEFLALLGHELRNPLGPLRNALYILGQKEETGAEWPQLRGLMERQVRTLARLVDDLLDVARITRGKVDLRREPIELAAVVRRAVETTRSLVEERGHQLTVDLPQEPLPLVADATRLEQVFTNLLNNAARYTSPGGQIGLQTERQEKHVVVRVRDSGIGIRPEMLPRVFDLFQQADRVPGHVAEGLGIGLTLVRNLVEMHGGTVAARSAGPGKGSEFEVSLPLATETAADAGGTSADPGTPIAPLRILVVDDNEDTTRSLALLLQMDGHDVRTAFEGTAALREAVAFRPDVALLDIGLPGEMDGHELARRIRAVPELASTWCVAVTGWGQDHARRRSQEAGLAAHLVKPIDPIELRNLLAELAARRPN